VTAEKLPNSGLSKRKEVFIKDESPPCRCNFLPQIYEGKKVSNLLKKFTGAYEKNSSIK